MSSTSTTTRRNGEFLKDWGPKESSEAGKFFRAVAKKGTVSIEDAKALLELTDKRILRHVKYWSALGAPVALNNETVYVGDKAPKKSAKKGKKFASKEEANAARNERRRKARSAAKNAPEVELSGEMPPEYAAAN